MTKCSTATLMRVQHAVAPQSENEKASSSQQPSSHKSTRSHVSQIYSIFKVCNIAFICITLLVKCDLGKDKMGLGKHTGFYKLWFVPSWLCKNKPYSIGTFGAQDVKYILIYIQKIYIYITQKCTVLMYYSLSP